MSRLCIFLAIAAAFCLGFMLNAMFEPLVMPHDAEAEKIAKLVTGQVVQHLATQRESEAARVAQLVTSQIGTLLQDRLANGQLVTSQANTQPPERFHEGASRAQPAKRRKPPYRDDAGQQHLPERSAFSQFGQDLWAAKAHPEPGFYLDIGAHHASYMSNTFVLDLVAWKGICIEPLIFKGRGWQSRTCEIIEAALVPQASTSGTVTFTNCESGGGQSGHSGLSANIDRNTVERRNCPQTEVKAVTIRDLLPKLPAVIDYMSLDVEGAELALLKTMPWEQLCISKATIENKANKHLVVNYFKSEIPHGCHYLERRGDTEDFFECDCRGFQPH